MSIFIGSRLILVVGLLSFFMKSHSQVNAENFRGPVLYAEAATFLFFSSINASVDLRINPNARKTPLYIRSGLVAAVDNNNKAGFGGLVGITLLGGTRNNHFLVSAGGSVIVFGSQSGRSDTVLYPLLDLGYRYQKPEGGFIFFAKIGTPGIGIGLGKVL